MEMEKNHDEEDEIPDWSEMPLEILEQFCKRLTIPEQLQFSSVCKPWLSSTSNKSYIWVPDTPWLIANDDSSSQFLLLSNTDQKVFKIYKPFKPLRSSFIVGSFKGWLIIRALAKLFILNPLSRIRIELPPETKLPGFLGSKGFETAGMATPVAFAISTCANLNPITIAMVTFGGDLAWCNIGDKAWKAYRAENEVYGNLIFCNNKLYAINRDGEKVDIFKVVDESLVLLLSVTSTKDSTQPDIKPEPIDVYLVESGGRVLVVKRYYDNSKIVRPTTGFVIMEVQEKCNPPQLVKVDSLEDHVLFVADYNCESLQTVHCSGLQTNSVYFVGYSDSILTGAEMGEFSVTSGTMRKTSLADLDFFTPLWVLPRFVFECDCNCKCKSALWIRPKKRRKKYVVRKTNVV